MKEELTQKSITKGLYTSLIGRRVQYYPKVGSTMEIARREALKDTIEGTVVITSEQTSGRGRLERSWQSPPGSISLSVILYPEIDYLNRLIMVASLAVVNTIMDITGIQARIKWPNDVLINGKKVCGILVESEIKEEDIDFAIIGIGINVNLKAGRLEKIVLPATSLSDELGKEVSRLKVARRLLLEIEKLYLEIRKDNNDVFRQWRNNLETLEQKVEVRCGDKVYKGIAEEVAEDGSLCLRLTDGSIKKITAGDVTLQNHS